ncbi:hypothetical protein [Hymenobacter sp. HDW8]|uniref:hypothetical protein n=1 Tax=Hymenobacter sp. HDW8 TaxID=2714932 RepID=UPI001408425C|nr:hypothetical protein [Hymenobacter sp. HDW8]QIL76461.1 hypothetical protein G7064_11760 [Hymenobacter sp. HDW8]
MISLSAQAQVINDPLIAAAARDSLLQQADAIRQQIAKNAGRFTVSAPRTATARHVVRGYYFTSGILPTNSSGSPAKSSGTVFKAGQLAWKHVTKTYLSGATNERYTGYANNGLVVLRERRHNGSVTWLNLNATTPLEGQKAKAVSTGTYTCEGYVRWGRKLYLAPRQQVEQ